MQKYNIIDRAKYTYFQLPKVLFFGEKYRGAINGDDRNAYAVLLDRLNVSIKNNWVDENGDIYFVYSNKKLMETLNVSKPTLIQIKKRLTNANLLVEERTGRANRLYLLEPIISNADEAKYILETEKTTSEDKTKVSNEERKERSKRLSKANKTRAKLNNLTSSEGNPNEVKNLNIRSKENEQQKLKNLTSEVKDFNPSKNNIVRNNELTEKSNNKKFDDDDVNKELEKIITPKILINLKNAGIENLTPTKLIPLARAMAKLMIHNPDQLDIEEVIFLAIETYEMNNGRSMNYIVKLLKDWEENELYTSEDIREYLYNFKNNITNINEVENEIEPVPMINWLKELDK